MKFLAGLLPLLLVTLAASCSSTAEDSTVAADGAVADSAADSRDTSPSCSDGSTWHPEFDACAYPADVVH